LEKCSKSGAKFDYKKGEWFNHQYIQAKSNEDLAQLFRPIAESHIGTVPPDCPLTKIIGLVKERVNFIPELWEQSTFFFVAPTVYDEKTVRKRWKEDSAQQLTELISVLESVADFRAKPTEDLVMAWLESKGYHLGNVMNVLRLALVGESKGPHIFDITELLGKTEVVRRIRNLIATMTE